MPERKISHRSLAIRIEALRRQHRELDNKVTSEEARSYSDPSTIKSLKRERLKLRDAIFGAQNLMSHNETPSEHSAI